MALTHAPGHAQVDFGEALGVIGGVQRKLHYVAMVVPQSGCLLHQSVSCRDNRSFLRRACLGGCVVWRCAAIGTIRQHHHRGCEAPWRGYSQAHQSFSELPSHDLFEDRFGRPGKGNDKGSVEGVVGFVRRNFRVPMPRFERFEALNAWLEVQCLKRQSEVLRGHSEMIGERLLHDLDARMALPALSYDACERVSTRATSISMVRDRGSDDSVPVAYAHHEVQVRGYVDKVVIGCGAEVLARHRRS